MMDLQQMIIDKIGGNHKVELREDLDRREANERYAALIQEMYEIVERMKAFEKRMDEMRARWKEEGEKE
jgi:hypothetical protein